jgi:hypothetical protein
MPTLLQASATDFILSPIVNAGTDFISSTELPAVFLLMVMDDGRRGRLALTVVGVVLLTVGLVVRAGVALRSRRPDPARSRSEGELGAPCQEPDGSGLQRTDGGFVEAS